MLSVNKKIGGAWRYEFKAIEEDGSTIASCFVSVPDRHLYNFHVVKDRRHQGVGTEFLRSLIQDPDGPKTLTAAPFDDGPPLEDTIRFYEKSGFKLTSNSTRDMERQ